MRTWHIKDTSELCGLLLSKPMYFYNDFEQCVVRTESDGKGDVNYWMKFKNKLEFTGSKKNDIVYETVHLDSIVLEKEDYDEF